MSANDLDRDASGHALDAGGTPLRWAYCIYCNRALTSWWTQTEGFGNTCYARLDRREVRRLYDAAVESMLLERSEPPGLRRMDVWRSRLGLLRMH